MWGCAPLRCRTLSCYGGSMVITPAARSESQCRRIWRACTQSSNGDAKCDEWKDRNSSSVQSGINVRRLFINLAIMAMSFVAGLLSLEALVRVYSGPEDIRVTFYQPDEELGWIVMPDMS